MHKNRQIHITHGFGGLSKKEKQTPSLILILFFSSQQNVVGLPVNSLMSARKQLIVISSGLIHV